jgi:hypothetical protein
MELVLAGIMALVCGICRNTRRLMNAMGKGSGGEPCPVFIRHGAPLDPHSAAAWRSRLAAGRCCCGGIDPPPDTGWRKPSAIDW